MIRALAERCEKWRFWSSPAGTGLLRSKWRIKWVWLSLWPEDDYQGPAQTPQLLVLERKGLFACYVYQPVENTALSENTKVSSSCVAVCFLPRRLEGMCSLTVDSELIDTLDIKPTSCCFLHIFFSSNLRPALYIQNSISYACPVGNNGRDCNGHSGNSASVTFLQFSSVSFFYPNVWHF